MVHEVARLDVAIAHAGRILVTMCIGIVWIYAGYFGIQAVLDFCRPSRIVRFQPGREKSGTRAFRIALAMIFSICVTIIAASIYFGLIPLWRVQIPPLMMQIPEQQ